MVYNSNIVKVITTKEYLPVRIYFLFTLKEGGPHESNNPDPNTVTVFPE